MWFIKHFRIKTPLSKVPILSGICFQMYKINKKILLAEDKLILGMHLKQSGLTYSAFELFFKSK